MKNDILMPHGVGPFRVQMIRNQLEASRINAVRLFKHEPCRTPVGSSRPSTSLLLRKKDVDARHKAGLDEGEFDRPGPPRYDIPHGC